MPDRLTILDPRVRPPDDDGAPTFDVNTSLHGVVVGLRLDPSAPPHMIGEAVRRVLSEPSFAERASALGRAIAEEGPGPARLVAEIEDFVLGSSQKALSAA